MSRKVGSKDMVRKGVSLGIWIRDNLGYDPARGILWLKGEGRRMRVPVIHNDGMRARVHILGKEVPALDAAYLVMKGEWSDWPLFAVNGRDADIRWTNIGVKKPGWVGDKELEQRVNAERDEELALYHANKAFLRDLARHHPNGPPTYDIKSTGKALSFTNYSADRLGFGRSPIAVD